MRRDVGRRARKRGVDRRAHDTGTTDQRDAVGGIELTQGEQRPVHGGRGGEVAPHRVKRDARQGYASCASTRCSPA